MTLSPDDYTTLNRAVADLRAWDQRDALKARAGGRRNAMIASNVAGLEDAHTARLAARTLLKRLERTQPTRTPRSE